MKLLAFGAHPDDIEIGAGGTLIKYARMGHQVLFAIATVPGRSEVRIGEARQAAEFSGAALKLLDCPTESFQFDRNLVRVLDAVLEEHKPDVVFTHWDGDSHQDHQALAKGVIAATRKNRCSLYMFEQTFPGGIVPQAFTPQVFIDISDVMDAKVTSVTLHKSQVKDNPELWEHGLRGRGAHWGYALGVKYAEVFQCVKVINRL